MRYLAGMTLLLVMLTGPTAPTAESADSADRSKGTTDEKPPLSTVLGRKVYFMDGSVGYVRPDGTVLFEKEPEEPPEEKIRIRLRAKDKKKEELTREGPAEPDWYRYSEPTRKAGVRIWTGPLALFRFGDQTGKVLTINPDGSHKTIQSYADGSRLIDDPAQSHLRRILPDGTTLLLERPEQEGP